MGIKERREREREQRKNEIIDAAEELFFNKGYENTSMESVAEKAEISKGTIYLNFENKNDLLHAIVHRALTILEELFENVAAGKGSGGDRMQGIGKAYYDFFIEYPDYFEALMHQEKHIFEKDHENSEYLNKCNSTGNKIFQIMGNVIRDGIADGSLRDDIDPIKHSIALWGQTTGIMQLIKTKGQIFEQMAGFTGNDLLDYTFDMIRKCSENTKRG